MADTILSIRRVGQETAFEPVRREGLSNFEALDLPSDSFDAGISRFALMLVPDIDEAHPNSALPKLGNLLDRPKSDISDLGRERSRPKLPHPSDSISTHHALITAENGRLRSLSGPDLSETHSLQGRRLSVRSDELILENACVGASGRN